MKSVYIKDDYIDILKRVEAIQPESTRLWGKMDAAQMLAHCNYAVQLALGEIVLKRIFLGRILGPMIKKTFLGEKPFSKNSPTAAKFVVVDKKIFESEKAKLIELIKKMHEGGENGATKHPHGFFGHLTPKEWGETQWKHLDHHLRQFGV
ncbi:hypothetical protein BH09BAC5_BH09BAC5_10240 [soil metagenome]